MFSIFSCSPRYPCSPNLLHVLQSGIAGFNEFCSPDICIEILSPRSVSENQEKLCIPRECIGKYYPKGVYQKISYDPRECIRKYYPRRVYQDITTLGAQSFLCGKFVSL